MDKEQYLKRINYTGGLEPNIALLSELQKRHLLNIPFENLDIHYKKHIELNIESIYKKIVEDNRGGFCYELNGLFYELLLSLNFEAKRISARVYTDETDYSPEFDHFAIIVKIGNVEYLTDVGFGEFSFKPLELILGKPQKDHRANYVIDKYDEHYFRVNKMEKGKLKPEYIFTTLARDFMDYKKMCEFHQSDSRSNFMKKRLISLATESGRITITNNILKVRKNNLVEERILNNETEFENELWDNFRIKIVKSVGDNL